MYVCIYDHESNLKFEIDIENATKLKFKRHFLSQI